MKCPKCDTNHPYKSGMTCSCGYRFCLDPKRDGMADRKFAMAVHAASQADTHYFTANQLYSVLAKRKNMNPAWPLGIMITSLLGLVLAIVLALLNTFFIMAILFLLVVALISFIAWLLIRSMPTFSRAKFDRILKKWLAGGNSLERMIQEPRLGEPPPEWQEPDIYDYGVESVLIVERDELVDLFVLNGFHTRERALVIAESGYPRYLLGTATKLIEQRADLPVYLLHDSTEHGAGMRQRVLAEQQFPVRDEQLVDLGIFPRDVERTKRFSVFRPQSHAYQVPVDYLPYAGLSVGLAAAVAGQATFADILDAAQDPRSKANTDSYGSFG